MKLVWKIVVVVLLLGAPAAFYLLPFQEEKPAGKQWQAADFAHFDRQNPLGQDKVSPGQISITLKKIQGVRVTYLAENSLLEELGFHVGDFLTEINAKPLREPADLTRALTGFLEGTPIFVEFYRHHKKETFAAKLM